MNENEKIIPVHPVQVHYRRPIKQAYLPQTVTMKAYEVYCAVHGKQEAMVTGGCRGGFSIGEIIGFLYAASFPRSEWSRRLDEAFAGMQEIP